MRIHAVTTCLTLTLLCSCASNGLDGSADGHTLAHPDTSTHSSEPTRINPPPSNGQTTIIASVGDLQVTSDQLLPPLIEAYGLQFTLHLLQLEIAKQFARNAHVTVTAEDIAKERQRTLDQLFKDNIPVNPKLTDQQQAEYVRKEQDRLLEQFLVTQRISMPEFNLANQTSAILRKVATPKVGDSITEDQVKELFNRFYGEKVYIRHIKLANRLQAAEALKLIFEKKETFEQVAKKHSLDENTREDGGVMKKPFSRAETRLPPVFIEAAFALGKPGDISDAVMINASEYQLIQLIDRIPPNKAIKYEAHREAVRDMLVNTAVQFEMRHLREEISAKLKSTTTPMIIHDSIVRKQYAEFLEKMGAGQGDAEQLRKSLENQRSAATQPETLRPPAK